MWVRNNIVIGLVLARWWKIRVTVVCSCGLIVPLFSREFLSPSTESPRDEQQLPIAEVNVPQGGDQHNKYPDIYSAAISNSCV